MEFELCPAASTAGHSWVGSSLAKKKLTTTIESVSQRFAHSETMADYKCCVPNCNSSGVKESKESVPFYRVTYDKMKRWGVLFRQSFGRRLTTDNVVCIKHFTPNDFVRKIDPANYSFAMSAKKPRLLRTATPSIFFASPNNTSDQETTTPIKECQTQVAYEDLTSDVSLDCNEQDLFWNIYNHKEDLPLPKNWSKNVVNTAGQARFIVYSEYVYSAHMKLPVQAKKITLSVELTMQFFHGNKPLFELHENHLDMAKIQNAIHCFAKVNICRQGPGPSVYDNALLAVASVDCITSTWRHSNCPIVLTRAEHCTACRSLWDLLEYYKQSENGRMDLERRIRNSFQTDVDYLNFLHFEQQQVIKNAYLKIDQKMKAMRKGKGRRRNSF